VRPLYSQSEIFDLPSQDDGLNQTDTDQEQFAERWVLLLLLFVGGANVMAWGLWVEVNDDRKIRGRLIAAMGICGMVAFLYLFATGFGAPT